MSKTLFWYLFRDLVRIFLLASGTLAGIMSFGGLMRPLTENGLDASQVGKMLTYLMPAMMVYSLPAAALFATTVAYGRLAADNELTACRAAGMSYTAIGLPAVVLGLLVAALSLVLLCFVVPVYSLKVEQVLFSNLGQVVVNKIQRDHQVRPGFNRPMVYAESAQLLPSEAAHPRDQLVQLIGPTVVTYDDDKAAGFHVPKDFFTAESATLRIHQSEDESAQALPSAPSEQVRVDISLSDGVEFPRDLGGADRSQVGVESVTPEPFFFDNPIHQNVKFMNLSMLLRQIADPSQSQRVTDVMIDIRRRDEERAFLSRLAAQESAGGAVSLVTATNPSQQYILSSEGPAPAIAERRLVFNSAPGRRQVRLTVIAGDLTTRTAEAGSAVLRALAEDTDNLISVSLELHDLSMRTVDAGSASAAVELSSWGATLDVPMDEAIRQLRATRTMAAYMSDPNLDPDDANLLRRQQIVVNNDARAELNGRASFAVSCLILVLVGCALGMMFKSGNFLTAFAVSFAPAMLCIALVVAGQQTADHIPLQVSPRFIEHNGPLQLGLTLIWSGNAFVLGLAGVLIARLRRR